MFVVIVLGLLINWAWLDYMYRGDYCFDVNKTPWGCFKGTGDNVFEVIMFVAEDWFLFFAGAIFLVMWVIFNWYPVIIAIIMGMVYL